MIRTDRICILTLIAVFALIIPSVKWLTAVDELATLVLAGCAMFDCLVNGNWRRYKLLWVVMGVMTFYAIYSVTMVHYNTPKAVAIDWIIQLKPFVPMCAALAIAPKLTPADRWWLRIIAVANIVVALACFFAGDAIMRLVIKHIAHVGITIFISAMVYYICSVRQDGTVPQKDLILTVVFVLSGLVCTRSKYYGTVVFTLFMLLCYRPGMLKRYGARSLAIFTAVVLIVIKVGWSKFNYYFVNGTSDHFDPELLSSYARPVMYATSGLIFMDHIPFGSGLASFGSNASVEPYSGVYHDYQIDKVYGISPQMPEFICDAFYPSLAQFGIAGVALFVYFWIYVVGMLKKVLHSGVADAAVQYRAAWSLIVFLLIEGIASTTFVQCPGLICMMIIGMICAPVYNGCAKESGDGCPEPIAVKR